MIYRPPYRALKTFLIVVAIGANSCAKVPLVGGSKKFTVELASAPNLNACRGEQGYPLKLHVLQVGDTTGIAGSSLADVWDREREIFTRGGGVLAVADTVVQPNSHIELKLVREPNATAVVLVGNFCKPAGSSWYYVHPFSRGSNAKASLTACCIESRKR